MRHLFLFFLACFFSLSVTAQYGINLSYQTFKASDWNVLVDQSELSEREGITSGFAIGFDRWFKLKNNRVEFLPEVNYGRYSTTLASIIDLTDQQFSLYFNTNFYLFDLQGDCDCPTFSKDGGMVKKGFFVQLSPGASLANLKYKDDNMEVNSSAFAPSIGLGAGLDIGITDLLTLTPMVKYRQHFGVEWENLNDLLATDIPLAEDLNKSELSTLYFGLRLGLRFDQ